MLHGRESLSRIIGKRRRTFCSPLASRLFSQGDSASFDPKPSDSSMNEPLAGDVDGARIAAERGAEAYGLERVSCPVCGASVRGDDVSVNSHLDVCLAQSRKRKLNQRTLTQISLCSPSLGETRLIEVDFKNDFCEKELPNEHHLCNSECSTFLKLHEYCGRPHNLSNSESCTMASRQELMGEDSANGKMLKTCSAKQWIGPCKDKKDTIAVLTLETFIVGRRFHEKAEFQEGARIYVSRDPENAKDNNAIKVFREDQGCRALLGYLPRELAKYLSPLIDNYSLKFEGFILSIPENPLDVVSVILFCQKVDLHSEIYCEGQQVFELLWEKVLYANESVKAHPSTVKYQKNFSMMLEEVLNNHSHLFTYEEKEFLGSFCSLSDDGQRLLIRLYTRKGPWFRLSNISYKEISDLNAAMQELQTTGYICSFSSIVDSYKYDMKEVLDVLSVSEMRQISKPVLSKNVINYGRKQELLEHILSSYDSGTCPLLPKMVLEHVGTCIKISSAVETILWRIQRLFFLNGEQDLSAFLLVDFGLIKFPEYTCTVTRPIFKCRTDFLEYEEAIEVAQFMDEAIDKNNMEMVSRCTDISVTRMLSNFCGEIRSFHSQSQPGFFFHFSASWVYSKMLTLGVSVYERDHRYKDAIRLLKELLKKFTCDSRRGYWTLRLSVDLEHLARINESLSVAEEGERDPWIRAGSKMALQRRVLRLGKPPRRWKVPSYAETVKRIIKEVVIIGRPLTSENGAKNIFYGYDGELCGVEQLALQYYAGEGGGWQGIHSESGIWMTIFGLLMWDVIFSDVPNVFRSKFQIAPLDLFTDDFYVVRKSSIESELQKIQEGMAEEMLITSFQSHKGTACHGVNWDKYSLSDLRAAVSCIGGHCLACLCRHLAMDYKSWSSGMPDLLLWRFHGGDRDGGEAKLVEVKGPRDRLSEQQRAWILTLMDCGFNTEVCKVSPSPNS